MFLTPEPTADKMTRDLKDIVLGFCFSHYKMKDKVHKQNKVHDKDYDKEKFNKSQISSPHTSKV